MNEQDKKILHVKRLLSSKSAEIRTLNEGQHFKNAERTRDEHAAVGESWKEFWQIFTLEDFPDTCPFCGEPLQVNEIDGCHIKIAGFLEGSWSSKKYIIPGHHGCNMQLGDEFDAGIGIKAVEAIEK